MRKTTLILLSVFLASLSMASAEEESPYKIILMTDEEDSPVVMEDLTSDESLENRQLGELLTIEEEPVIDDNTVVELEKSESPAVELQKIEEAFFGESEDLVKLEKHAPEKSPALNEADLFELTGQEHDITPAKTESYAIKSLKAEKTSEAKASRLMAEAPKTPAATGTSKSSNGQLQINLAQVFAGSPIIYSILLCMSVVAFFVCLYNIVTLRGTSENFIRKIRQKLMSSQYDDALALCLKNDQLFGRVLAAAISNRKHGLSQMLETMKAEGKRATVGFWQRIALLNDIAIIAPMLGLLGTVLGMFYAFYDLNRSRESVSTLFDGLGISVGTTVAGLVVAILAMMLHSYAKFRLVRALSYVEDEAQSLAAMMDPRTSFPSEK